MKTVFITGASRGIGSACVKKFAENNYNVAFCYNNSEEKALDLEKNLTDLGYNVKAIKANVTSRDELNNAIKATNEIYGKINVLVNNAGIAQQKMFCDITDDDWDNMFNTNVKSMYYAIQGVMSSMVHEKSGAIINISSMWGETGGSCEVHYSASKAAVIGLTKALAKELGPSNINVNCVAPGAIMTDMLNSFDDDVKAEIAEETPLQRIGEPNEIAESVYFLASDGAKYITGQTISVNGGRVI